MPDVNPALLSMLKARVPMWRADLYTFTLRDATVLRWTSADVAITLDAAVFSARGPLLQRSRLSMKNTIEVPELEIALSARDEDTIAGKPLKRFIHDGGLRGATVYLERAFMVARADTAFGSVPRFAGRASTMKVTATGGTLVFKGHNVVMNQMMPRNLYQPGCGWTLYRGECQADRAAHTIAGIVGGGSTADFIVWDTVPATPEHYGLGTLTMTSGAADTEFRMVRYADSTGLQLVAPLFAAPAPGDTFSVSEGCDKTETRCADFGQSQRRRGFQFIPQAETAV